MQGNDIMKNNIKYNRFSKIAIVIMVIVFITNFFVSDCNLLWMFLSGGGKVVDYTSVSYATVFRDFQLFRLITYGYTQTAVWHLLANLLGLWYVGLYLEKKDWNNMVCTSLSYWLNFCWYHTYCVIS